VRERERIACYRAVIDLLEANRVPFLLGGAYALHDYTGIPRDTKDFDLMVRPKHVHQVLRICRKAGYQARVEFSHWLAKIIHRSAVIDVIFRAGNGLGSIDDNWFNGATKTEVFGRKVRVAPPEEIIWQKAYIMERERYDGADVAHLIAGFAERIKWNHLLDRFGPDWRVLLSHLILFGFVFPGKRDLIPKDVMNDLLSRLMAELNQPPVNDKTCNGTLLSRIQYHSDIAVDGLIDARTDRRCKINSKELKAWTAAGKPEER
jgi:hypothetical protein